MIAARYPVTRISLQGWRKSVNFRKLATAAKLGIVILNPRTQGVEHLHGGFEPPFNCQQRKSLGGVTGVRKGQIFEFIITQQYSGHKSATIVTADIELVL